jgi:hypothetical protein
MSQVDTRFWVREYHKRIKKLNYQIVTLLQDLVHVPPRESVSLRVRFVPPDSALESPEDSAFVGNIALSFSNGAEQVGVLTRAFLFSKLREDLTGHLSREERN